MRKVHVVAAAIGAVLAAGAASVAVGRLASGAALKLPPGRPLPTEPRLTVHAVEGGRITLTRDLASRRPGVYGLAGNGSHAVVGPVLEGAEQSADTVVRALERVTHGTFAPGDSAWLTPNAYVGDPGSALGLEYADIDVPGELGALPAWFVPGQRDTWVIAVHGLGATREQTLNVMGILHALGLPVLALAYRGDLGAPAPRTASATSARPSGGTWKPRSATPSATAPTGSSSSAGPPAPPWPCAPPNAPPYGTVSPG